MYFSDLNMGDRVDSAKVTDGERPSCIDVTVPNTVEDIVVTDTHPNGSIAVDSSQHEPDGLLVSAVSSGDSVSMRHSAADSVVYCTSTELSLPCGALPDNSLESDQSTHSAPLNGYCTAVETSQVRLVQLGCRWLNELKTAVENQKFSS